MPLADRPELVLERDALVVLGAVDNVDKHLGQRLRHAFGLFVRAAPLGLTGSEAASDLGVSLRDGPWAGLGVHFRNDVKVPRARRERFL